MSDLIQLKRSSVANAAPTTLADGELALNFRDGKLYYRDHTGAIVEFAGGSGLSWSSVPDSATATGTAGQIAYDGSYLYVATAANTWERAALSSWATDPFFSNVAILLRMDGSGATFVDSSPSPKTITAVGSVTQSTTQSKWGGKSAYFDGSGDALTVAMPALGTSDFVIEMWLYLVSNAGDYVGLYDGRSGDLTSHPVLFLSSGVLTYYVVQGGDASGATRITGGTVSAGAWHHVAVARSSGTTRMYFNGTQAGSSWSDSTDYPSSTAAYIGSLYNVNTLNGYIDDVRVTIGADRGYTGSTITVPTAAFHNS